MPDVWNPSQYERFRRERAQPFWDLVDLIDPRPGMRVADLGCGTGDLTLELHRKLGARETIGVDNSPSMLEKAPRGPGLRFVAGEIETFEDAEPFDLIFSNAAFHWVPDHPRLFKRLRGLLAPGGQIAVQMPMNDDHASHATAYELARTHEFRRLLHGFERRPRLMDPAAYASLLHHLGFDDLHVRLQIYGHLLDSREDVVEWVRGALLTDYQKRLAPPDWDRFLSRYRELLLPQLADERPFFYTYPRILIAGKNSGRR